MHQRDSSFFRRQAVDASGEAGRITHMEVDMELSKKTTILFPPDLHEHLVQIARRQGRSLGELVRLACESQYGLVSKEERLRAVEEIGRLNLPVGDVREMKRQSVPAPDDLLP